MQYIGKLDKTLYRCVTENIITDEVIITDERIQHIMSRHPGDFEQYGKYIPEIISEPDYILRSKLPNTAFLLKKIGEDEKKYELILRIKVCNDPVDYKNSILTFLKIEEKKWKKYLRNKEILYKRE